MLKTTDLNFSYSKDARFDFPNMDVKAGESLLILGSSGVGKTTLLHILAGLLKPIQGEVIVDDQSIYDLSLTKLDAFRGAHISVVFQKPHFISSISAVENLKLVQKFGDRKNESQRAQSIMEQLDIGHRSNARTYQMSQGEQQRLSIARAVINTPKLILADEPTSALDDNNCEIVFNLLSAQAKASNAALIIVTHDQRLKDKIGNHINL